MRARTVALVVLALPIAGAVAGWRYVEAKRPQLELGVGYAARVACGCRFISGRPLASCPSDFEPGMEPIRLREDAAAKTVTAYVPLIAHRTVRYDPVLGCRPEPYRGERLIVR